MLLIIFSWAGASLLSVMWAYCAWAANRTRVSLPRVLLIPIALVLTAFLQCVLVVEELRDIVSYHALGLGQGPSCFHMLSDLGPALRGQPPLTMLGGGLLALGLFPAPLWLFLWARHGGRMNASIRLFLGLLCLAIFTGAGLYGSFAFPSGSIAGSELPVPNPHTPTILSGGLIAIAAMALLWVWNADTTIDTKRISSSHRKGQALRLGALVSGLAVALLGLSAWFTTRPLRQDALRIAPPPPTGYTQSGAAPCSRHPENPILEENHGGFSADGMDPAVYHFAALQRNRRILHPASPPLTTLLLISTPSMTIAALTPLVSNAYDAGFREAQPAERRVEILHTASAGDLHRTWFCPTGRPLPLQPHGEPSRGLTMIGELIESDSGPEERFLWVQDLDALSLD